MHHRRVCRVPRMSIVFTPDDGVAAEAIPLDGTLALRCRTCGEQEGDSALAVAEGAAAFEAIRIANR